MKVFLSRDKLLTRLTNRNFTIGEMTSLRTNLNLAKPTKYKNSHELLTKPSKKRSVSTETYDENTTDDVVPHEPERRRSRTSTVSSFAADKAVNATDDKRDEKRLTSTERDKSKKGGSGEFRG